MISQMCLVPKGEKKWLKITIKVVPRNTANLSSTYFKEGKRYKRENDFIL